MLARPDACRGCPLDDHPQTRGFTLPAGPTTAPILFVGEAAGDEEARTGVPFQGPAGGMLNRLLERNHWDRRDARVANVIQCQPPNNWFDERAPWYWGARQHCAVHRDPVLAEQHPVIVALGGTALKTLIGLDRGIRVEDWHACVTPTAHGLVVPTFHPSHLQRGAHNLFGVVSFDLQQAYRVAREGWVQDTPDIVEDPPVDWFTWWVGQVEAASLQDPEAVWLTVDIETPDKSEGQDEGELSTEDRSYTILRVNFSVHPDEGITVPYAGPYVALIDQLLRLPCVKTGWNCPTPDQRVLTADLRWVRAGDVKVGDHLVAFDEEVPAGRRTRRYRTATVTHAGRSLAPVHAVHLSNGQVIKVTGAHPWLVKPVHGARRRRYNWTATTDLREGQRLQRLFNVWETGTTRAHGYLAGFFDGEGNLGVTTTKTLRVSVAQNRGPLFDHVCALMQDFGYPFGRYPTGRKRDSHCWNAHLLGRTADVAKFLGEIRPERLLPKFTPELLGALQAWQTQEAVITAIVPLGVQEIVTLSTSTRTYVLEGFGAHNCEYDRPRLEAAGHQINGEFLDGMWLWHFLQSDLPRGLGFAAPFYSRFGAWKHLASGSPARYAACDGFQNWRTVDGIVRHLQAAGQWDTALRHVHRLHAVALKPAQQVGLLISRTRLDVFIADLEVKQRRKLHEIQGLVPDSARPLTPKGGYKREPEAGRVHSKGTALKRDGSAKKEAPDPVKQDLYAQTAVLVERRLSAMILVCRACGAAEIQKRHRCEDHSLTPDVESEEREVTRWFWQEPFNPDSPDQILGYLKIKGHKPGRAKKTGADSTDRDTLQRLVKETKDPLYQAILDSRAIGKVRGTYGVGTRKLMDAEDRVHPIPTFRPSTMRLSYVSPNITNVVADKGGEEGLASGFRRCVVAGEELPGWVTPAGLRAWEAKWTA